MDVQAALSRIHAPKGVTSLIAGVMSGDFDPIRDQDAAGATLARARAELEKIKTAQANCKSDWAYWGYEGDKAYWRATVSILEAAELVGADNLPDVPAPNTENCVVMDACWKVEQFGAEVLKRAKESKEAA